MLLTGYCFSASLPPMLAAGALKALDIMQDKPKMFNDLQERAEHLHDCFKDLDGLELAGDRISTVKHLRLKRSSESRTTDKNVLNSIVLKARELGVALVLATYLEDAEVNLPPPSIRLTVSNLLDMEDIRHAGDVVGEIARELFNQDDHEEVSQQGDQEE